MLKHLQNQLQLHYFVAGLLLSAAMPAALSHAAVLHVDASKANGDGTQDSPFKTINGALAAAQEGDTIRVAAGSYTEPVVLLKSGIKLHGGFDSTFAGEPDPQKHETAIDGEEKHRAIQVGDEAHDAKDFEIKGFTIRRGLADGIEGSAGKGAGLLIENESSGRIVECKFVDNKATDDGGAIESGTAGALTIDRCLFRNNSAGDDGGAIRLQNSRSKTAITNCVFINNSGLDKYIVQAKGAVRILNCTFFNNMSADRGIIASRTKTITSNDVVTVTNCIFANNVSKGRRPLLFADDECAPIVATHCLFFENTTKGGLGTEVNVGGNLEGDPLFVDAAQEDIQIKAGSPAIDRGASQKEIESDHAGMPRLQGSGIDIGAFEFAPASAAIQAE